VKAGENYVACHIHVDTLVSRASQLEAEGFDCDNQWTCVQLLFIIRVNREIKTVYRNGCRYNERLNTETGGSKTPRTHWVVRVNI
jgi:hypothetical protein